MGTIKEEAQAYEPKTTKTVDQLDKVSVDMVLTDDEYEIEEDGKPKTVHQKIFNVEGEDYRVPDSVLKDLKVIIGDKQFKDLKFFKVTKTGEGFKTKYTVMPLVEQERKPFSN